MRQITTHILDTSAGCPASGVEISLQQEVEGGWEEIGSAVTNEDGRIDRWSSSANAAGQSSQPTNFKLTFHTATYFTRKDIASFFPYVEIVFTVNDPLQHYHVPLLLNPFGYSTYRGS